VLLVGQRLRDAPEANGVGTASRWQCPSKIEVCFGVAVVEVHGARPSKSRTLGVRVGVLAGTRAVGGLPPFRGTSRICWCRKARELAHGSTRNAPSTDRDNYRRVCHGHSKYANRLGMFMRRGGIALSDPNVDAVVTAMGNAGASVVFPIQEFCGRAHGAPAGPVRSPVDS